VNNIIEYMNFLNQNKSIESESVGNEDSESRFC